MYIKINTINELIPLSTLDSWLGKNRIPLELLECAENLITSGQLGKKGFVAIIPNAIEGKMAEIQDILNIGRGLKVHNVAKLIEVSDKDTWLTKKRKWHRVSFTVERRNRIYVLYSTKTEKRW